MNDSSKIAGEIHKAAESKAAKIQENDYYKKLQEQIAQKAEAQTLWAKGVDAKGATTYFINASSLAAQADFSTISTHVTKVGTITRKQLEEIAKTKQADLNANDLNAAVNIIAGTCRSMGVTVAG
jgi:hypothetical protein